MKYIVLFFILIFNTPIALQANTEIETFYKGKAIMDVPAKKTKLEFEILYHLQEKPTKSAILTKFYKNLFEKDEKKVPETAAMKVVNNNYIEAGEQGKLKFTGSGELVGDYGKWKKWIVKRAITGKTKYTIYQTGEYKFKDKQLLISNEYKTKDGKILSTVEGVLNKITKEEFAIAQKELKQIVNGEEQK